MNLEKDNETMNLVDNVTTQPSKYRAKDWVEINDDARGTSNPNNQIKLKVEILKQVYVSTLLHIYM